MSSPRRVAVALLAAVLLTGACSSGGGDEGGSEVLRPEPSGPTTAGTAAPDDDAGSFAWRRQAPRRAGFSAAVLEGLAADAEQTGSTCLLVARRGRVVGEWYWQDTDERTSQEVYSVTKSVTSTLVGLAQADGVLDIDESAANQVRQWRGTPSAGVTVRNLLANDSGREWSTRSDYTGLIRARDRTAYAVGLAQQFEPGTAWAYNNAAIQTLDAVLSTAVGETTAEYATTRLFEPLGMDDTRMTGDAAGTSTSTAFGLNSTCRDLARFGTLFAQRGEWDGERVLPAAWVDEAVGAPSQDLNAAYGLLWWLNRGGPLRGPLDQTDLTGSPEVVRVGQVAPGAPDDLFAAQGFGGQVVLVDPSSRTVVVRLGVPDLTGATPSYSFVDAARVVTEARTAAP